MTWKFQREKRAKKLLEKGLAAIEQGAMNEAVIALKKAASLTPTDDRIYYNLGLIFKYQGQWNESLEFNQKAFELAPDNEAANWNVGIAATALENWVVARDAWSNIGLEFENIEGPVVVKNLGMIQVRLNSDGKAENVWAERIDPARARILNVPLPDSGFRYRDTVLHDGAAVGYIVHEGINVPIFNMLEVLEESKFITYIAELRVDNPREAEKLFKMSEKAGAQAEDWTDGIVPLCKDCSEDIHEYKNIDPEKKWKFDRTYGIAALNDRHVFTMLNKWKNRFSDKIKDVRCEVARDLISQTDEPNSAESTEGYSIRILYRHSLEYTEGDKTIVIGIETYGPLAVYASQLNVPNKLLVTARVSAALDHLGVEHEML